MKFQAMGLYFPDIEHLLNWPGVLFEGSKYFELNKGWNYLPLGDDCSVNSFHLGYKKKQASSNRGADDC